MLHSANPTKSAVLQREYCYRVFVLLIIEFNLAQLIIDSESSSYGQSSASVGTTLPVTPKALHTWRTATPGSALQTVGTSPRVYQFIRELNGIQGAYYQALPLDDTPLPSFGDVADGYLQSHGYTARAVLCIAHAVEVSQSGEDFVHDISGRGLAITEARWLWLLITGDNTF
jgi:hypothetical protein